MYKRIKGNIINPRILLERSNDKIGVTILYFLFLVLVLAIPSIVMNVSFTELSANSKESLRISLSEELDIPCSIDNGLQCDTDDVHEIALPTMLVVVDPTGEYAPTTVGVHIVLREEKVEVFSARQVLLESGYGENDDDIWPSEWSQMDIDVNDDGFWNQLFAGVNTFITEFRSLWLPISILSSVLVFVIVLLTEVMFNTLILSLFRIGRIKFGQMFKVVLNAMTLYVIINVILGLYRVQLFSILDVILQMIPLIYVLVATRMPIKR